MYKANLTITTPDNQTITLTIDTSCSDCQNALNHFVNVENTREKGTDDSVLDRIPLMIMVDPIYNNTIHFEKMKTTICEHRKIEKKSFMEHIEEYAKNYLSHCTKIQCVKELQSKFQIGLISIPLGIWKLIEIIIFIFKHIKIV